MKFSLSLLLVFSCTSITLSQSPDPIVRDLRWERLEIDTGLFVFQLLNDSVDGHPQNISMLALEKARLFEHSIALAYVDSALTRTSKLGAMNDAKAAVNGGFFSWESRSSVTYMEVNGKKINPTSGRPPTSTLPISFLNGALIIDTEGKLRMGPARSDNFYEFSINEEFVLITGPLLLQNGISEKLEDIPFNTTAHPRTCICETEDQYLFIVIDGRSEQATGMDLFQVQDFMQNMNCINGINLDGGGSTTLWTKEKNILNQPSDKTGERPVANALLIF